MKSPISKVARIGTVAGLAALAASEATQAAVIFSSVSMVDLSMGSIDIDLDGDGNVDFSIIDSSYGLGNPALSFNGALTGAAVASEGFGVIRFDEGYQFSNALLPNSAGMYDALDFFDPGYGLSGGEFYVGIQFNREGELHFGWLLFDLPNDYTLNGATLVSAAWESTPYESITIGAVPEASTLTFAALAGGLFFIRRRK